MKQTTPLKRIIVAAAAVLAVACAQPPVQSIDAARSAVEKATTADATDYAPAQLQEAKDSLASLDAELAAQQSKFVLTRSYDKASELASGALAAAERASAAAAAGRELARNEATIAIESLRASIVEVRQLLEQAPTGKGTAADIAAMKADLASIEGSLGEVEQSLGQGKYKDAAIKARASLDSASTIKAEITAAIEARKAGRRRG
jgi:hypothetical protein